MSLFPETIKAHLAGRTVRATYLVKLDFTSAPMYLWNGNGLLETGGIKWEGLGGLGNIDGLEQAVNGEAPEATITLSGIDSETVLKTAQEFETEVRGRKAIVYMQFFQPDDDQVLDNPYPLMAGKMMLPQYDITPKEKAVIISCESLFNYRSRPNFSMYTDRDQNRRFPGDRGFEFVASLVNKTVAWPDS